MESPLQRRTDSTGPGHSPKSAAADPRIVVDALGANSIVGQRFLGRRPDDQRAVGDGGDKACVPRGLQSSQVPHPGGRLL